MKDAYAGNPVIDINFKHDARKCKFICVMEGFRDKVAYKSLQAGA